MAEHTPGPWTVELSMNTWGDYMVLEATNEWGDRDTPPDGMSDDEATKIDEANARLIAVAPELLQVAYLAVSMGWGGEHHPDCDDEGEEPVTGCICGLSQVLAAIAKAEGRE